MSTGQVKDLKQQFEGLRKGYKMTSTGTKVYGPPKNIPVTPSNTINNMLQSRCGKQFDNPVKYGIAFFICQVYTIINKIYGMINPDKNRDSHTMWMAACGVVSVITIVKAVLVYNILMASAFLLHYILFYAALGFALFGTGLGVSGMVFFDKDGGQNQATFRAGVATDFGTKDQ